MEQRSEDWFAARRGKVTASRVSDVLAKTKTGYGASRSNYMAELICERLTGVTADRFNSPAMAWGTEHEGAARDAYAFYSDVMVEPAGFVLHPRIADFGASPDGLVDDDGLVEIKCPNTATHIETLLRGEIDKKYLDQMQVQMACTGRSWCDFVSFDPRMPADMQIWIKRVPRNDVAIEQIEAEVGTFLDDMRETVATLQKRYGTLAA